MDDATGIVVNALFCELESTRSYFLLMRDLIRSYGIPIALYADRHAVFKHTPPSEVATAPTQFSRAMDELGVQLIFARSPQAKGRVERIAGTLQDRLVTELRLAHAATINDANRVLDDFLPRFNERFRVPAHHTETAYRDLDGRVCLDTTLCLKYRRRVGRDNTVKYRWRTLQLLPGMDRPSYAGAVVDVLEGLDGQTGSAARGTHHPHTGGTAAPPTSCATSPRETAHTPAPHLDSNGLGRRWADKLAQLDVEVSQDDADSNGAGRARKAVTPRWRKPTPLQTARWRAGPEGEAQGVVHTWDRPGAGHTQEHREEVYGC